jgi:phenylalanyl-tRNA synthetase alpha chain
VIAELDTLEREALDALAKVATTAALDGWKSANLGANGVLKAWMQRLKEASREERPALGKRLNEVKGSLERAFEARAAEVARSAPRADAVDVTEPGIPCGLGRRHVLTRTIDGMVDVFGRMGFSVADGPEVEDEWHNFTALNIPESHPAREPTDNFWMAEHGGVRRLLRTQTSTVQIRTMESTPPPLRIIAVGRVYRPDTHDATHYSMFHQMEGLAVDEGLSMADLKTTLLQFARAFFGPEAEVRLRPSFFPFTEPSAEIDIRMQVRGQWQWVELGGCGMVDPNVFAAVGIDPERWTGFAFGLGVERIAMRRYGIPDIRWLFENDLRFLRQFG